MDRFRVSLLLLALFGCGPSIEDHFVQLGKGGEESEGAKHELLISGEQAIPDLLSALEDPRFAAGRHEMVDVLTTLMLRTEAPETIGMALERHLLHDPDTRVRSRIAQLLGLYKREEFARSVSPSSGRHVGRRTVSRHERPESPKGKVERRAGPENGCESKGDEG